MTRSATAFQPGFFGSGSAAITGRGQTTFEWLDGRFFLTQRFVNEHPAAPSGIAIIGTSPELGSFTQHYYDSRGVARVYQMTLDGQAWKLWRQAPGFWQRYTGSSPRTARRSSAPGSLGGRARVEA
jgi:hypothetical protein